MEEVTRLNFRNGCYALCERLYGDYYIISHKELYCEDWKYFKDKIPPDTKLGIKEVLTNFYGKFVEVKYKGKVYYIDPLKVDIVRGDVDE